MEEKEHKEFFKGSEINKVTMIRTIKGIMIDLFRGYPAYEYWGIIEGRFGDKKLGEKVREKLEKDGIIEIDNTNKSAMLYRLTSKGVDFAISIINLDFSQNVHIFNKEVSNLTIIIVILTIGLFALGIAQLFLTYIQNPIF